MIGDLFDSPWKILIVAAVILVLFGSAKLPGAARSLGKSMRILKAEVKDLHEEETEPAPRDKGSPGRSRSRRSSSRPPSSRGTPAERTEQAQQRIDALQRQLDDLKQPVAGAHSAQRAVQLTGQPTQQVDKAEKTPRIPKWRSCPKPCWGPAWPALACSTHHAKPGQTAACRSSAICVSCGTGC